MKYAQNDYERQEPLFVSVGTGHINSAKPAKLALARIGV